MPLNLASPGILIREVDLTNGRVDTTTGKIGGIVGAFEKGPMDIPTTISSEDQLLNTFGKPYTTDKQYEEWLVASSYLAYGGQLSVIRADDTTIKNARTGSSDLKIKNEEHYEELGYDENTIGNTTVVAKNPGTWANNIKVAIIDDTADQILTLPNLTSVNIGMGVTQAFSKTVATGIGTTVESGVLKGIVTEKDATAKTVSVKVLQLDTTAKNYTAIYKFDGETSTGFSTDGTTFVAKTPTLEVDWWDQQELEIVGTGADATKIKWNTVAEKPGTSGYAAGYNSKNDELHVVVIDGDGAISGNAGTILEKNLSLSKAKEAEFSVGSPSYWRKYLQNASSFIYGGGGNDIDTIATGFTEVDGYTVTSQEWDQVADTTVFNACGSQNLVLANGKNYGGKTGIGSTGALNPGVDDIIGGIGRFENDTTVDVDFIMMGSAKHGSELTQAIAGKAIAVAEARKDAVAFISPSRSTMIDDTASSNDSKSLIKKDSEITQAVKDWYSSITSSSYAVFDSGYKYMFDRFNNKFRWIPLNGDIAGTCARTDINDFPWFSPAGTDRGTILNAVKLAYNPTKLQRDEIYPSRINPVIHSPGAGIVLFGDRTGFGRASAFDRINVRRLFIYLEDAIAAAAKDQLFEFNDEITRSNFVNIVEPFLRDVQAKRGIQDYVVVCDETNNTAAVIDSNEFIADIYIKPARSINFIGLTFVATRTGVSFEEIIGNV